MISNCQKNELLILYFVLKTTVTAELLSQLLKVPKRTIKEQIRHLNATIEEHFRIKNSIQSNNKGEICFNPAYQKEGFTIFFELKLIYLKQSINFLILTKLVTNAAMTPNKLAKDLFISRSYLSRRIKLLNSQLKELDIAICLKHGQVFLRGDEVMIRILGFLLLSDSFHSIEWPFHTFSQQELKLKIPQKILKTAFKRSEIKNNLLRYLFGVMLARIAGDCYITTKSKPAFIELVTMMNACHDISTSVFATANLTAIPADCQSNEKLYFDFFCHIFAGELISASAISTLGEQLLCSTNNYARLAVKLIKQVEDATAITVKPQTKSIFLYFLTLQFAYYDILENKAATLEYFLFQSPNLRLLLNNSLSDNVEAQLNQFVEEENISYLQDADTKIIVQNLLATLLELESCPKIYVYIQIYKEFSTKFIIEKMITSIFSTENVVIIDDFSKADLIITDNLEKPVKGLRNIYFFDSLRNHSQWQEILQLIQNILLNKLFSE